MPHIDARADEDDLWPTDAEGAERVQQRLAERVRVETLPAAQVSLVAGVDVSYAADDSALVAAVTVLDTASLRLVEAQVEVARPRFPYVPGLLAFREVPPLLKALERLECEPDVYLCDGFGLAHPRRFGLACHLGVLLERPTLGVAKSAFVGRATDPGAERGAATDLVDDGEVIGRVLRTRTGVKPVYVSTGHRVDLAGACDLVLRLCPRYRLPEPIRHADQLSRARLAER
ncbi:deoxyribonuclease V [Salinactinospora qingdaonensis]|uniref:Endonuclease V n=1 Tax=Salinactinospora qingdaonensis TaxID=702744 RepID=A0ABP7FNP2_9ACTN